MSYDPSTIEPKWQQYWDAHKTFAALNDSSKEKYYCLIEFPYPSGEGLHVGHPRSNTALDILARYQRMQGKNVLYPIGWDAFGLPSENYAIKTGINPAITTKKNIETFRRQLKALGFSFDWDREVDTTDPNYYKWTQWLFLQFYKHGLAYKANMPINWCPKDKTGLANEEVVDGCCERCGTPVEKRNKAQWMLRITDYADRLLSDLDGVDYLERIKAQQRNWIGKSSGVNLVQKVKGTDIALEAYDSVPQTFMAQTFTVIAPEHPLLAQIIQGSPEEQAVKDFVDNFKKRKASKGFDLDKEVEGIFTGRYIDNPFGTGDLPIWVASFVVADYGTGFVNSSAHDKRDFAFAKKYGIPLHPVMFPADPVEAEKVRNLEYAYDRDDEAVLTEPVEFKGRKWGESRDDIIDFMVKKGWAYRKTQFKLRDWVFSRQRYWGEPIPLVHCDACAQKKQKVLLIHGFEGGGDKNWFGWMKTKLEAEGFEVFSPTMSTAAHPDLETWMNELLPFINQMGEDDVIVGHSLGSKAALHLVERAGKKIGHLILIASAIAQLQERDWDAYRKLWPDSDIDALRTFWETPFNWPAIDALVGNGSAIFSNDDPYITAVGQEKLPHGWLLQSWNGFKHFQSKQIPELFDVIRRTKTTGWVPVPVDQLPVVLPPVEKYEPTDSGESPLGVVTDFVNTTCPQCGGAATRETDTMPTWAGSSWYFLRYVDPSNATAFASADALKHWLPVDWYNGGMEHTTLHLLYSRFWYKFLYDLGYVPTSEPYQKRTSHGLILGEGGEKMSKSRGNVVNPDDVVKQFGADTLRLYEMFMGPFDQAIPWDTKGVVGCRRFLDRIWQLYQAPRAAQADPAVELLLHKTIKKIGDDILTQDYNTAVSAMMIFSNAATEHGLTQHQAEVFAKLLSPFAPHLAEELWQQLGHSETLTYEPWPIYDAAALKSSTVTLAVQISGKVRATLSVPSGLSQSDAEALVKQNEKVARYLTDATVRQVIYVADRVINFVL